MPAPTAHTAANQRAFLVAFAELGNITAAARSVGIDRRSHYDWLRSDPAYPDLFAEAEEQAIESLEQEARRRAVHGTEEPVFWKGEQVGGVRKYSDTLLIFLLKGARPERYRERFDVRQQLVTVDAVDAEIARLEAELAAADQRPAAGVEGTPATAD